MLSKFILAAAGAASLALAQQAAWQQCGGKTYTGPTTCASGSTCVAQNAYYSQCIPGGSGSGSGSGGSGSAPPTTTKASNPAPTSGNGGGSSSGGGGSSYKASFTQYGSGDQNGSGNCNVATTACGFYTNGYSAAVSQNEFGVGPGAGAGPACGTCWKLTIEENSSNQAVSNAGNSIVVQVTNLCPASGNPLCAQNGLGGTNQYGANLNFDLCIDSKANSALFGNSGVGLGVGTAEQVSCSEWSGSVVH